MALYPESGYSSGLKLPSGVRIRGSIKPGYETVLTHEAVAFVADLARTFRPIVQSNLALRALDQAKYDAGGHPGFDFRTKAIREEDWTCAPMPAAIQDRRVEITGPVDRKMVINALNSGAKVFMVRQLLRLETKLPNLHLAVVRCHKGWFVPSDWIIAVKRHQYNLECRYQRNKKAGSLRMSC